MRQAFVLLILLLIIPVLSAQKTIVGEWKIFDDKEGKHSSNVRIYKMSNDTYAGEVTELISAPANSRCVECQGKLKNAPIIGLRFVFGLKLVNGKYESGRIIDPKNGKEYYCNATLHDNGLTLKLKGSLDKSGLFGRTQVWKRKE